MLCNLQKNIPSYPDMAAIIDQHYSQMTEAPNDI